MDWFKQLIIWDQHLLVSLNNFSAPWADGTMLLFTATFTWVPFYAVLLYLLIKHYKYNAIWSVLCIVATIALCDQIASSIFKPWVLRLRPCYEPSIAPLLRMVTDCGGEYGFFSSHSANSFGLATFVWLLFHKKSAYWNWIFVWATVVSYTRIYLGKHYPLDIIAGVLCGMIVGFSLFKVYEYLIKKFPLPLNNV